MNENDKRKYEEMKQCADKLGQILCSYQGRGHQSVYIDMKSLALFVGLLMSGEIKQQNYQYDYNSDIYEDEVAVSIYAELAPQTRWRLGSGTQIEPIRMNALRQFVHMGTPVYEDYIYYRDTESVLVCGEILPHEVIELFAGTQKVKQLYIYPYPYRTEHEKAVYYSFEPTEKAIREMKEYMERIYDKIRGISLEIWKDND